MYPPLEKYGISSGYKAAGRPDHRGIDIPCPIGTPLPSPVDGVIAFEGYITAAAPGYGKEIICIIQGQGEFVVMGHLSRTTVNTGQRVKAGDIVAYSGNTGYVLPKPTAANPSAGQHLHIELCLGTKDSSKGLLAYPTKDITPLLRAYGSAQGGATDDMTIIIRPISMLKVNLKKPLQMYNIETGQPLWNSGDYMELTGKSNIVRGASYLIPVDRMANNDPYGFLEHEVMDPKNQIHDTQFDPKPFDDLQALSIYYRATGHPQAEEVSQNHVAAGTTFEAVMQTDMAWYKEKVRLLDEVLKKDVPPKLTEQDQKDLDLGRKFRAVSKEANAKS